MSEGPSQFKSASEFHKFDETELERAQEALQNPEHAAEPAPASVETVSVPETHEQTEQIAEVKERLAANEKNPAFTAEAVPMPIETSAESVSSESTKRMEDGEELFNSLSLPKKGMYNRRSIVEGGHSLVSQLVEGLNGERQRNEEVRKNVVMGSAITSLGGIIGGGVVGWATGGGIAIGSGMLGGLAFVGAPVLAAGALGWAGLKIYHGLKQRKHRKEFNKIYHKGSEREPGALHSTDIYYR